MRKVAEQFPGVELEEVIVDAMAAFLIRHPEQFDVIVTTNLYGDILSDEASELAGSLGLAPSINAGHDIAMAQAQHGSAPDIAGKNIANPYSMIGSVAMMLEHSFDMLAESKNVWKAMQSVFADGYSTADLSKPGSNVKMINTDAFGDKVVEALRRLPRVG